MQITIKGLKVDGQREYKNFIKLSKELNKKIKTVKH